MDEILVNMGNNLIFNKLVVDLYAIGIQIKNVYLQRYKYLIKIMYRGNKY